MKIGILTIIDNNNYGNRLQNYALQEILIKKFDAEVLTFFNYPYSNGKKHFFKNCLKHYKHVGLTQFRKKENIQRKINFSKFDEKINFYNKKVHAFTKIKNFDYVICGSDQVWNANFGRLKDVDLLCFVEPDKRISYAASFGVGEKDLCISDDIIKYLNEFTHISVREDSAKKIIEKVLPNKTIDVVLDPTMLLKKEDWEHVIRPPKILPSKNYILNYFLGELSEENSKEIKKFAESNNCEIINILEKNSPYYSCGPAEFLWLENNAYMICTDSFHSSVFAIIFERPFVIFERKQNNVANMNTRIDTLLSKLDIKNRKFNGTITLENLNCDFSNVSLNLNIERDKSLQFIGKALKKDVFL